MSDWFVAPKNFIENRGDVVECIDQNTGKKVSMVVPFSIFETHIKVHKKSFEDLYENTSFEFDIDEVWKTILDNNGVSE